MPFAMPGDRFPYLKAMWHYAQGVAYAARGDPEAARSEADAIASLAEENDFSGMIDGGGLPLTCWRSPGR